MGVTSALNHVPVQGGDLLLFDNDYDDDMSRFAGIFLSSGSRLKNAQKEKLHLKLISEGLEGLVSLPNMWGHFLKNSMNLLKNWLQWRSFFFTVFHNVGKIYQKKNKLVYAQLFELVIINTFLWLMVVFDNFCWVSIFVQIFSQLLNSPKRGSGIDVHVFVVES